MKWIVIAIFVVICGISASPITKKAPVKHAIPKDCSIGPSYWCTNLTTSRDCGAVKHCIQTVWEHTTLPPDNDDICTICKNMVAQARDQLESNETQEELKEVFEGSCRLIPIKLVAKECIEMADEFIPELVEALASQMNPQMVCATAGLCNSVRIDKLLAELNPPQREVQIVSADNEYTKFGKDCAGCHTVVSGLEKKLAAMPDEQILSKMVKACGYMGSLSTGCYEVVITNFEVIVKHLRQHVNVKEVCDFAGVCKAKHHEHAKLEVEVAPRSESGLNRKDETCELCEQLVKHLRDVLVSNTTQDEFQDVLKGLCRQTKSFKDQCLSLVNEYYGVIYSFLVDELNPRTVCDLAGICHEDLAAADDVDGPLWLELPARQGTPMRALTLMEASQLFSDSRPLIGRDEAQSFTKDNLIGGDEDQSYTQEKLIGGDEAQSYIDTQFARVPLTKVGSNIHVINAGEQALPMELLMPEMMVGSNKEVCELCQYFLHYVQQEISSPSSEAEIKEIVDEACDHLPKVISSQCRSFVATYGDAFVALLAQEIDPSEVCPSLGLCPSKKALVASKEKDSPTCPLCLYAMEQLDSMLKENKTEEGIRAALEKVCDVLPKRLKLNCDMLVDTYAEQLVDMMIADFTPEETCVYLKLCHPKLRQPSRVEIEADKDAEIISNEIPQLPEIRLMPQTMVRDDELVQRVVSSVGDDTKCVICEFVMTRLDEMLKNNATEEEIKQAVHSVCNYLPGSVAKQCNDFVYEYADLVIQLLVQTLDPKSVCVDLSLCPQGARKVLPAPAPKPAPKGSETQCKLCVVVVEALDKLLEDGNVEKDIDKLLETVCRVVPGHEAQQCRQLIDEYGPSIALLVAQLADSHEVCSELKLCSGGGARVRMLGGSKCTWGPSYWCQSEFHAVACKATKHCQAKVWNGDKPSKKPAK